MAQLAFKGAQISTRRWVVIVVDHLTNQDIRGLVMASSSSSTSHEIKLKLRQELVAKWTGRFVQRLVDLLVL
jgi:hypothetical protein